MFRTAFGFFERKAEAKAVPNTPYVSYQVVDLPKLILVLWVQISNDAINANNKNESSTQRTQYLGVQIKVYKLSLAIMLHTRY